MGWLQFNWNVLLQSNWWGGHMEWVTWNVDLFYSYPKKNYHVCLSGLEIQRNRIDFVDLALEIEKNLECVLSISFKSIDLTYKSNCHQNNTNWTLILSNQLICNCSKQHFAWKSNQVYVLFTIVSLLFHCGILMEKLIR